ncbi:MAG: 50S ribosomal protein L18 [Bdellovibrionales bacterium GWB1_55_8]|nr:MAG: 50S ribosomal protein L18 [Bdellovibrionales bacterium GWB1_55_8]
MSSKIGRKTSQKKVVRAKRKLRIRARIEGNAERPRLSVFRSNQNLYVQLVDDTKGHTLVAACTLEEDLKGKVGASIEGAKNLGTLIAKRALAKNISQVVFDRSGYLYHGRVKALADAAREGGLKF